MPPKARKQPARQNRTGGGMEELLAGVLDELKTLKEQMKAVTEAQQLAVPAVEAQLNIAQVPLSSLPMVDLVTGNVRKDIISR